MGEVFSRAEGYDSLTNLIGALAFHTLCMVVGGLFFFKKGAKTAVPEGQKTPAA